MHEVVTAESASWVSQGRAREGTGGHGWVSQGRACKGTRGRPSEAQSTRIGNGGLRGAAGNSAAAVGAARQSRSWAYGRRSESRVAETHLQTHVHGSIIHESQKVEAKQGRVHQQTKG